MTGFTNEEELFLIPDARVVFPFLLEDRLREQGAEFSTGLRYLNNVVVDDGLVTGQNPWSVYATVDAMIRQLGHEPVTREITGDENSVTVLAAFYRHDKVAAREQLDHIIAAGENLNRNLLIVHGLVAAMDWQPKRFLELLVLAQHAKSLG